MDPVNVPAKFEVHSFTHSRDNRPLLAIAVLGWGCKPQSWRDQAVGGRGWYYSKERW